MTDGLEYEGEKPQAVRQGNHLTNSICGRKTLQNMNQLQ